MGSTNGNGRDRNPGRRPNGEKRRKRALFNVESLENRLLLNGDQPPSWVPTSQTVTDTKNGPLANAGLELVKLYLEYQQFKAQHKPVETFVSSNKWIDVRNGQVGISITVYGDVEKFKNAMLGPEFNMIVRTADAQFRTVEGYVSPDELVDIARFKRTIGGTLVQTIGISPLKKPMTRSQGAANNQAEDVLGVTGARQVFPTIDGSGVTVGVISDSANRVAGGLQDSINTGDLPALNRINVLLDGVVGDIDEGRAMMELIYDIAPGVNFGFHTSGTSQQVMADGIRALSSVAGAEVLVDDIGFQEEPVYQPGPIEQAISDVVLNENRIYLTAAGNDADRGFESPFRSTVATVGGFTGTFMDFDAGPGVVTQLPVTFGAAGVVEFQFDQPWFTSNGVVSDVDILIIDPVTGNVVVAGNANNVANQRPFETLTSPVGNFTIAIFVRSGPAPGRINILDFFSTSQATFSKQFGNAGGITYPTSFGHAAPRNGIGVGAVNFFNAPPFSSATPIPSSTTSSFGPRYLVFDAAGNRLPAVQTLTRPNFAAPDGTNTTFFGADIPQDTDNFPNFFGTSAAAPNLAAVVALMRELSPGVRQQDVIAAFKASAIPINGQAAGQWNAQSGFGMPQATRALQEVDQLRVTTTTPANGATLSSSVSQIVVNFNKTLDPSTIQAGDLVFTGVPAGVAVTSIAVQVTGPTTAVFTLQTVRSGSAKANGGYAYRLDAGSIAAADGKVLAAFTGNFSVQDTVNPRILGTNFTDRRVVIQFSEAMDPNTINPPSVQVVRAGNDGVFGTSDDVNLSGLPGYAVTYHANFGSLTNVAIIDLSALDQSALPSGRYALWISDVLTDIVGNRLDGEFNGVFPSGDGKGLPAEDNDGDPFFQDRGVVTFTAPNILIVTVDPLDDTGIGGDQNTNNRQPRFTGQVSAAFPGALSGLQVYAQWNALHGGTFDLAVGPNGRGISPGSNPDVVTTTDDQGRFSFQVPSLLNDGFHQLRVIVVGKPEISGQDGRASQRDQAFRIDTTLPLLASINVQNGDLINNLGGGISLSVEDRVQPLDLGSPFAVPTQFQVDALNPETATNISNYRLINLGSDNAVGGTGSAADVDLSNFITGATFTDTSNRTATDQPYTGRVDLSFATGLPAGRYQLIARFPQGGLTGVTDAAGNAADGDGATPGAQTFVLEFELQPTPTFVTNIQAVSPNPLQPGQTVLSKPRAFYEDLVNPNRSAAPAPPNQFFIDFSAPLATGDYTDRVQLLRSADSPTAASDGDFGLNPNYTGTGVTRVSGLTVTLVNSILGAQPGQPGFRNRLRVDLPTLPADKYRLFIPNSIVGSQDLRIFDQFGNHVDGEFLGNPTASGGWETLLPTGQHRSGISGDLVEGGSLVTGFTVVPTGNVLYVKPDYVDDPFLTSDDPDGSLARPYAALAPEATPTAANGGDLNSDRNFGTGFNRNLDLNGNGRFDRSVFFAAAQRSSLGPVVIVALPGSLGDPLARTFVLQKPSQADQGKPTIADGSATVPFNTVLVFNPGSILKMRDASLFVQNQGSAIQLRGGPNPDQRVFVTSFLDDSVGGDTNRDGSPAPAGTGAAPLPGDFGGIVLRNFDDTSAGGRPIPVAPGPVDTTRPRLGISGADDSLSYFNFGTMQYGGGAVPQTIGFRFDAITLFNSRPHVTNMVLDGQQFVGTAPGPNGGSQAGISGDMDSFREDTLARGPLVRKTTVRNTSLNGIYVRAELNGNIQPTNAVFYPNNPGSLGGQQNYTFDDPLPYILTARMIVGSRLQHNTGLDEVNMTPRVYVQPGMIFKFQRGAAIEVLSTNSSINFGDRTYINQFDRSSSLSPNDDGFVPQQVGSARIIFTSFFDDTASTAFIDPNTGASETIVEAIDSDNGGTVNLPTPGNVPALARWGSVGIVSGARAVIDEVEFRYGGGSVNLPGGTIPQRDVLAFNFNQVAPGTRAYVTNNNFFDNQEAAISVSADGLLAADPLRPLQSGNPFFRGNVLLRNDVNALEILPVPRNNDGLSFFGYPANLRVNSVWDDTDIIHALRTTIVLAGVTGFPGGFPQPSTSFTAQLRPSLTLTMQSSLPETPLADGGAVGRPGESLVIKLLNDLSVPVLGDGVNGMPNGNVLSDSRGGAGWLVGMDDGNDDPVADLGNLVDPGALSQIRILGIPGNETTGQPRVPVKITSLRDNSVGITIRGVTMNESIAASYVSGPTANPNYNYGGTAPAAGDGGMIGFGANSLSDYNLYDPRDGNIIDSADISFMTRIEMQGGGWAYSINGADSAGVQDKIGVNTPLHQFNTAKAMTISNSNLASFSQVGVLTHPSGSAQIELLLNPPAGTAPIARGNLRGQPVDLFMVNNTISNTPVGVRMVSENQNNDQAPSPYQGVFLHNTFVNAAVGIQTQAPLFNGQNSLSHVYFLAMDNIFANSSTVAVQIVGQNYSSQLAFNLFSGNTANTNTAGADFFAAPFNAQPIIGNAAFRDPQAGDFVLTDLSDAIDAGLSEITQSDWGNMLRPIANQVLDATTGVRNTTGRNNAFGGLGFGGSPGDIVTLPGFPVQQRGYVDQWIPALPGTPGAIPGPGSQAGGVFFFLPISGERDQAGFLRQDDPDRANVGFGSRPFFDVGAIEFRELFPVHVTDVLAILPSAPTQPTSIYVVGGTGGASQTPLSIQIELDQRIDPATVNNLTILLQSSGGDGIFGNANNSQDTFIPLSGKLSYDAATSVITIGLSTLGLTLLSDLYRITVRGTGANVVRNTVGLPVDGENTEGATPNGAQLPLPSGDGVPGGDFFVTFSIDTSAPSIVAGSLVLATDTGASPTDRITATNPPTFTGTITDVPPPTNPLLGQTVILDIDINGDGVFELLDVGRGTTDANGNFSVTPGSPLPQTPFNVGPDGLLGTADDSGYSVARIRIIDQSGNSSSETDPNARLSFVVDSAGPRVTGTDPLPGATAVIASGGVQVSIAINENIDPATLNTSTIQVIRTGGDGIFGNGNDVTLAIDPASIVQQNLLTPTGAVVLRFNVLGVNANDLYRVTLVGDGTGVADIAGNQIDGEFNGAFPSGDGSPGGSFVLDFIVFDPSITSVIFVAPGGSPTASGSRFDPFGTITAALNAATVGTTIAVIGGTATSSPVTYTESIVLKSLVKIVSAHPSSTDTNIVPGLALKTVIAAPFANGQPTVTISASNLVGLTNFATEVRGFSIASPLSGLSATSPINSGSIGVDVSNSDILLSRNIIITSGIGVRVSTFGASRAPRLVSNVIAGNITGVSVEDVGGTTTSFLNGRGVILTNNDLVYNTTGLLVNGDSTGPVLADVTSNIFWQNAERTILRAGSAITATNPGRVNVRNNLFSANGPSINSPADDTVGVGGTFNPALLSATPDGQGNFTGNPAFVSPLDPRPDGNGPGNFFLGANYDITSVSAAIDNANTQFTPATDFLFRSRVDIPGRGFAGTGPGDVGAFEFNGTGGIASGASSGSFGTPGVNSLGLRLGSRVTFVKATNSSVTLRFAGRVNRSSVQATDLLISGNGLNPSNPAHAVSLNWIDSRTVRFNLAGEFLSTGTVQIDIAAGAVRNTNSSLVPDFNKSIASPTTTKPNKPNKAPKKNKQAKSPAPAKKVSGPKAKPIGLGGLLGRLRRS
jgi:hypothetical protein